MSFKNKKFIKESIEKIAKQKKILDVGGGQRFGKWLKEYEPIFKNSDYKTFDYDNKTGADFIGDIHNIPIKDGEFDAVICSSVLEHVKDPLKAMAEIQRIIKKGGLIFFYVPSIYPYHAKKGHYPDYWRFFEDTILELFKDFSEVKIEKRGGYFTAISFFVPLQHKIRFILDPLSHILDIIFKTEKKNTTSGYYVFARK